MTISAWTTEVKSTQIPCIKCTKEVVPQSCFDLTFDVGIDNFRLITGKEFQILEIEVPQGVIWRESVT